MFSKLPKTPPTHTNTWFGTSDNAHTANLMTVSFLYLNKHNHHTPRMLTELNTQKRCKPQVLAVMNVHEYKSLGGELIFNAIVFLDIYEFMQRPLI